MNGHTPSFAEPVCALSVLHGQMVAAYGPGPARGLNSPLQHSG